MVIRVTKTVKKGNKENERQRTKQRKRQQKINSTTECIGSAAQDERT